MKSLLIVVAMMAAATTAIADRSNDFGASTYQGRGDDNYDRGGDRGGPGRGAEARRLACELNLPRFRADAATASALPFGKV